MEPLRIRIPHVVFCKTEECRDYSTRPHGYCWTCVRTILKRLRELESDAGSTRESTPVPTWHAPLRLFLLS